MAKIDTIQNSFAGGEIGPQLYGRTDVAQYQTSVSELENFLVRPYGSVISTPGTEFINACKTGGSTGVVRLVPFMFSRTDSYVIEMGVGYFRFYTDGATVITSGGSTPYEIAHTYAADELFDVQLCQLNDVMYLCHANHPPATLIRVSSNAWTLSNLAFTGGPFIPDNVEAITIQSSGLSGTVNLTVSPTNANLFVVSGSTLGHKNTYWKIGSTTTNSTTGLAEQGYVQITNVVNSYTATASVIKVLTTTAATTVWAEGSWSDVNGWPSRVTFHQQRLFMARTNEEPQTIWGSKSFTYTDFAVDGGADDDAINIELASNESNDIKWLAPGRDLIAGTYGGEFTIQSGDGSPLTPSNTNVNKQTSWGSEPIIPKKIGSFFYYVQRFAKKLRELFYYWDLDSYKSVDKTILAPHISGGGFLETAYQQNPDTVLWCVCTDGTIATMTREVDQEVTGWARQITDGKYESICAIPSIDETYDEVWVVVKRNINGSDVRYVERFKNTEVPTSQDDCWYVHSGLKFDAYNSYTSTTISISKSWSSTGINYANDPDALLIYLFNETASTATINDYIATNDGDIVLSSGASFTQGISTGMSTPSIGAKMSYMYQDSYIQSSDVIDVGDSFSICGWYKTPSYSSDNVRLFDMVDNPNNHISIFNPGIANRARIYWALSSSDLCYGDIIFPLDSEWHHIAVTFNRSGIEIGSPVEVRAYVDSVEKSLIYGSVGNNVDGSVLPSKVRLLNTSASLISPHEFSSSEFAVFGRVLTSDDILNIYTDGLLGSDEEVIVTGSTTELYLITSSSAYFSSGDVGQRIRQVSSGTIVAEAIITGYTSSTVVVGRKVYAFTSGTIAAGDWALSVNSLSGLNHLEGETVVVLADGGTDKPNKVVSNGSISLTYNYFKVIAGLPYTQKLKTLPQEAGAQRGTAQGKKQRINEVGFKVNRSHKGFLTGGALDTLDKIRFRDPSTLMGQPELLYTGVIPNITFRDDYRYGSQVIVQNPDPLPIELLNIITAIDTQEK